MVTSSAQKLFPHFGGPCDDEAAARDDALHQVGGRRADLDFAERHQPEPRRLGFLAVRFMRLGAIVPGTNRVGAAVAQRVVDVGLFHARPSIRVSKPRATRASASSMACLFPSASKFWVSPHAPGPEKMRRLKRGPILPPRRGPRGTGASCQRGYRVELSFLQGPISASVIDAGICTPGVRNGKML
jgi:hypothetical protein